MKTFLKFLLLLAIIAPVFNSNAQTSKKNSLPRVEYNYTSFSSNISPINKEIWAKFNPNELQHADLGIIYANASDKNCVEIIAKRTEFEKYYINPNKPSEFYTQKSLKPLNYKKGNEWYTIDYRLHPQNAGIFEASRQMEPVGFDLPKGNSYIITASGKVNFNKWTLIGKDASGKSMIISKANWSNSTVGDNGVYIKNVFAGIDAEMRVARGGIKTNFIIKENKFDGFEELIFQDVLGDEKNTDLAFEDSYSGKVLVKQNGKSLAQIDKGTAYLKSNPGNPTSLKYELDKNKLGVKIDVSFIRKYISISPIIVDPLVTGTASFASTKAVGSMYNASCGFYSTCGHNLDVTTPAGATFTDIVWTFGFEAKSPCLLNNGFFTITSTGGSCISPYAGAIWIADYAVSDVAAGVNMPGWTSFSSCLPAATCNPGSITFTLNFGRGCVGISGCDNACIGEAIDYPFSVTVKGKTVEHDGGISVVAAKSKDTICQGASLKYKIKTQGGISPYSTTNWSSSKTGTPSLGTGDSITRTFTTPGTFWTYVITSDMCSNVAIDSQKVFVDSVIAPGIITPVANCLGSLSAALTASKRLVTDTLLWYGTASSGGSPSRTATIPSTTTLGLEKFYVSQKSYLGCESVRSEIFVNTNSNPIAPSVITPVQLCFGVTAPALTATGTDLKWYSTASGGTGSTTATIPATTATGSASYYVSQSNTAGCESPRAEIVTNVNSIPAAPSVVSPVSLCQGITATALSAVGSGLLWYNASSGGVGTATAITPATTASGTINYYVSQISAASAGACESPRATIAVTVNAIPAAPIVLTPLTLCVGSTPSSLSATGTNLKWYAAASGGSGTSVAPVPATTVSGTSNYYVSQSLDPASGSCESNRSELVVIVNTNPAIPTVVTPVQLCAGIAASALTASGSGIKWYTSATGGVGSSSAPIPATGTAATTVYYVSQSLSTTSGSCESDRTPINVVVNAIPAAPTVVSPVNYCQYISAIALTAMGSNLKWYSTATSTSGSATAFTPITTTASTSTYYVSQSLAASSGSCESPMAAITVNVTAAPAKPTVSTPVTYCQYDAASALTATGSSLKWYSASSGGSGSTSAPSVATGTSGSTTYYVTQSSSTTFCESLREALVVTINPQPAAPTVTSPIAYCYTATTATALAATGSSLKWYTASTGGTGSTMTPTPATTSVGAQNFYVSQTNSFTCESPRAAIVVNVNPLPAAPSVTSPVNLCLGSPLSSLSVSGTGIKWYSAATGGTGTSTAPMPPTTALASIDYYVSQTNTYTCEGPRAKITADIQPLPVVSIKSLAPTGFIFCRKKSINIEALATTATSYQWSINGFTIAGATAAIASADTTGRYKIEVTDVYGCKNRDSIWVQKDTTIVPVLTPSIFSICEESSKLFTVSPGYTSWTFNWIKDGSPLLPATTTSNTKNLNLAGNYTVITKNTVGCLDTTNTATLVYLPKPAKPVIINKDPILEVANVYTYYQWHKNSLPISAATSFRYTTSSAGLYFVEVSDKNGCTNQSDTIKINLKTSVQNIAVKAELKIYPNPTRNIIHVEAPLSVKLKLMDPAGRLVLESHQAKEINMESYAQGMYLLMITDMENNLIGVEKINKVD